jgi:hypothetical protein
VCHSIDTFQKHSSAAISSWLEGEEKDKEKKKSSAQKSANEK